MKFFIILEEAEGGAITIKAINQMTPEEMERNDPSKPPEITQLVDYLIRAFETYEMAHHSAKPAGLLPVNANKLN